jgi:O-antigen ligase
MTQLVRVVHVGSLYVLLFLLPFSKAAIEVTSVLLVAGWLLARLSSRTRADTVWGQPALRSLALTLLAYLGVCALSILVSDFPGHSVRALFSKWLQYAWLFVVAADLGRRPSVVRQSLAVVACSSVFVLIEGLSQERLGRGMWRGYRLDFFDRMTGPYENPIDLATYLMVVIPLLLASSLRQRSLLRRVGLWALLAGLIVGLAKTMALGAWLGLGVGVICVVCVGNRTIRRSGLIMLGVAVVACGLLLRYPDVLNKTLSLSEVKVARAGAVSPEPFSSIGNVDRLAMWQAALRMIRDRPILGHGLNTFMANYLTYWVGGERQPRYAHNCYLQVAAETGIVGLVLFVIVLWQLFSRLMTQLRRSRAGDAMLLSGFLTGLLAFVVQAGIDTNFYSLRQAALFWTLAGLAVGYAYRVVPASATQS